ncbi:MAG: alpha-glucuronidase, partial [Bacteroidales bacterium]|nr:alpha-glucuronidase [Bacteroidales bacterium]
GWQAPFNDSLWLNSDLTLSGEPAFERRILNHWDNLDDTIERGYAGHSIWEWTSESIPTERIAMYGKLNQKIGINGTVLNNVNASPKVLDKEHLERVRQIADILRDYGMQVYLSVNFATPSALKELPTSDPLDQTVKDWWKDKVDYIYSIIPDFGGFLVKASSEGQSGPQDYGRTHVDGANMIAAALEPHGGILLWRSFVYSASSPDRAKQAYEEFQPLDGQFASNVIIQVKNGPVDFQPTEPVSPLFLAMDKTPLAPELQITQEYLGQGSHLVFLSPMWKECLDFYPKGNAISGVANIGEDKFPSIRQLKSGLDRNWDKEGDFDSWCGHIFAQANWYAFGRLAWDPTLSTEQIAREWVAATFPKPWYMSKSSYNKKVANPIVGMMVGSRQACVDYMMPLGLHHIFAWDHHYGPEPWCTIPGARPDWLPKYYHKADSMGIGFDRTTSGSDTVSQYPEPLRSQYNDVKTCPEQYLLWFHHLPWDYGMPDGNTLWQEMCLRYQRGIDSTREYLSVWRSVKPYIDPSIWQDVESKLEIQAHDAVWWKDACLGYFQTFSGMPLPGGVEPFETPLDSLKKIHLRLGNHN